MEIRKPNILLGLTGSVASILGVKLLERLQRIGNVAVILTEKAKCFVTVEELAKYVEKPAKEEVWGVYEDSDEWKGKWHRGDDVLHITLRNWADILVVAPLSANTLAKFHHGLCDNLLTSVFRAWDMRKPCVMAPAMNTMMLEHPVTSSQLWTVSKWFWSKASENVLVVPTSQKTLACGDIGNGAMADVEDIAAGVVSLTTWQFPLTKVSKGVWVPDSPGIPVGTHPGAFGVPRKMYTHPGVDLYTTPRHDVVAMEPGTVVANEIFTGPLAGSPWWNDTAAVLIEGRSGVVCYGEISSELKVGDKVRRGELIGYVFPVLKEGKERPDIAGHSRYMLHIELYSHGQTKPLELWAPGAPKPDFLMDPTELLFGSVNAPNTRLTHEPSAL
jgi:phosphopantothenoylcysteine decarboxylase